MGEEGTRRRVLVDRRSDLVEGTQRIVSVASSIDVGVIAYQGGLFSYENRCSDQGGPVCEGSVIGLVEPRLGDNGEMLGERLSESGRRQWRTGAQDAVMSVTETATARFRDVNQPGGFDTREHLANARRQAEERGLDGILIVDVDAHRYETEAWSEIASYLEDDVLRHLTFTGRSPSMASYSAFLPSPGGGQQDPPRARAGATDASLPSHDPYPEGSEREGNCR